MIPYVGWTPEKTGAIDATRAVVLYDQIKSWRLVGVALAKEEKRELPYLGASVYAAVRRHRKLR